MKVVGRAYQILKAVNTDIKLLLLTWTCHMYCITICCILIIFKCRNYWIKSDCNTSLPVSYLLNPYLSWAPDISAMSWSLVIHILSEIEENTYIIEENTYFAILLLGIEGNTYLIEENTYFLNRRYRSFFMEYRRKYIPSIAFYFT